MVDPVILSYVNSMYWCSLHIFIDPIGVSWIPVP